jgi:hypothetical protein
LASKEVGMDADIITFVCIRATSKLTILEDTENLKEEKLNLASHKTTPSVDEV